MGLAEGMIFMESAKAAGGLLWHNDRISNKPELGLGCLSDSGMGKQRV
jgi:hypothetical protein